MIKDRGVIKWTAMMLPEHVKSLKDALIDEHKIEKPEIDEQAIEEFELIICEAMEFNNALSFEIYENGFTKTIKGTVSYINHLKSQVIVQDADGCFHHITFQKIINVDNV